MARQNRILLLLAVLALALAVAAPAVAQQYVVFKVKTQFDSGAALPDSARMNDYYVKIGTGDGAQIGTIFNVYRDKEITADFGNFKVKTKVFVGRVRAFEVHDGYSVCRVSELAKHSDPHRERDAVMSGDYVQPVFVVQSENLFDKGSSNLLPEAMTQLDRAITFISRYRPIKVRIEGHTDSDGEEDLNMALSQDRANSVRDQLVTRGSIDTNTLVPVGYGESKPIASNETLEGQRKNRRFEIVIEQ